ncbi:ATP phosphoribosyltransferase regulatory subunit [Anoxynatronum sibiricum]|uniref:ATP phosphoribosyltransferase regulatory subunit n=1 Tax=Anoxynatronum sibiricum TaxID=210623 RepID=A0ABU9VU28_9CLOT
MNQRKVFLPQGVQDLLIDDCLLRRVIENQIMETFTQWGYMEVSSPALEYYDLFTRPEVLADGDKMFKLIDADGRILVLRPDCTIPMARVVATKMRDFVYPLKLCYVADVFRIDQEQAGKKREFRQAGIELFGVTTAKGDAEVLVTAIETLKGLGLQHITVELGSVKYLKALFRQLKLTADQQEAVVTLLEEKNVTGLQELAREYGINGGYGNLLTRLPRLFGTQEEVKAALAQHPQTPEMGEALAELQATIALVADYGLDQYLGIDLGMVNQLDYYTGIIFKGFTRDLGTVLLSGGRYDALLGNFGMDCPATGFALVIHKITKALKIQEQLQVPKRRHVLVLACDTPRGTVGEAMGQLRQQDDIVEFCLLKTADDVRAYMKKRQVDELVRIHPDGRVECIDPARLTDAMMKEVTQ